LKRSTIKDVAEEAGVAISTVSLALSGKGYVSEQTLHKVERAVKKFNYTPARAAQRLASRSTGNIGFVLRDDHFTRSEPFYTQVLLGSEYEANHHELYVLLSTIPYHFNARVNTPRFLKERNVDGLLVAGKVDQRFLETLDWTEIPTVLIDFEFEGCPAILIDNEEGAIKATGHLIEKGHRTIAFLGADTKHPSIRGRMDGYKAALSAAGLPVDERLIITSENGEPDMETGRVLSERLLSMSPLPTAVFCANDAIALPVLNLVRNRGLDVPGDLAIVGFDDVDGASRSTPDLTTVRVFKEQLGELAVSRLAELISSGPDSRGRYERSNHTVLVPTELIIRGSA
jgi:LacI family transcriptional regulator